VPGEPAARGQSFPSAEPNLSVTAVRHGAAQVLQVKGEVDATSAWRIDSAVMGVLPAQIVHGPIIVDLSGVTLFSAAGITALVPAGSRRPVRRVRRLSHPRPGSHRLLMLQLHSVVCSVLLAGLVMRFAQRRETLRRG
jgi:hypothetical protein